MAIHFTLVPDGSRYGSCSFFVKYAQNSSEEGVLYNNAAVTASISQHHVLGDFGFLRRILCVRIFFNPRQSELA
jgi:hypothetical protein